MPITLGDVTLEYKSLPLVLREDGSASVTIRKGYTKDGAFVEIERQPDDFLRIETRAFDIARCAIDAEPAVINAEVRQQYPQYDDLPGSGIFRFRA